MKKRIICLLLSLVLVLSLVLGMCVTAFADTHPALTVTKGGSSAVENTDYAWDTTDPNKLIIKTSGLTVSGTATTEGRISVEESATKLTIKDLNLTSSENEVDAICFDSESSNELILKGTNTIKATGDMSKGINSCGSLTVSGDGNLNAASGKKYGIRSNGNLTLSGTGTMRFDGALAGIYADGSGNITVSATVSTIISYGNDERFSGVSWNSGTLSLASGVTMTADADYRKDADSITGAAFADDDDACVKAGSNADAPAAKSVLIVGAKNYNVWVNDVQFTSANATTGITCGSGTATLDTTTTPYTLTLTNANITTAHEESYASAAVFTEEALKVVLVGTNTITTTDTGKSGFYASGVNLTLEGSGSLTVNAKKYGIEILYGDGDETVTLGGSGKLEIEGNSGGIYASKNVTVVFSNTNSTPVSITSLGYRGIESAKSITLSGTGSANITAVNTAVYGDGEGDVTFSGSGNLALEGGHEVNGTANGIYVQNGDVKFTGNGGQVSVTGDGDAIYLGTSGKKVVLSGSASPITLTAGDGHCAVRNSVDSTGVVDDTESKYDVDGAPNTPSAVYTLKVPLTDYYITVNDIPVTSLNKDDVLGDGKVSYDPTNDKLNVSEFYNALTIVGNNTVDIELDGGSTNAVTGKLTVSKAHDVSASSESSYPTISSDVSIDCTGDVVIENTGTSLSVAGNLTVANANNVTVRNTSTDNGSPVISGTADVTCTGDVLLETAGTGFVTGAFAVKKAKNVTVLGNSTSPILTGSAEITCTGDLSMTNNGTSFVSTGSITVHNAKDVTIRNANTLTTSQVVIDKLDITCTGNVLLENAGTGFVVGGTLDVQGAKNVTVRSNSATPTIQGITNIDCTGDVVIENKGDSLAAGAKMTVSGAKNVTVSSASTSPTTNGVEITCTGDLAITNSGTGMVCGGSVTVHSARNVTIHNTNPSSTYQVMNGITNISSSGDVLIQTSGSGYAVNNNITYTRIAGAGGYAVRTGDTEATLTTVATKAENEVYSSENCKKNILNIVPAYTLVWANGEQFTSEKLTVNAGGGTATLDVTTSPYTLTLNNYDGGYIKANMPLDIIMADGTDNKIASTANNPGISTEGNCKLKGKGNLSIAGFGNAIWVSNGDLTVDMSGDLIADAAENNGIVTNGDVIISGSGRVTVNSDNDAIGLYGNTSSLKLNGTGAPISLTAGTGEPPRQDGTAAAMIGPGTRMTYKAVYRYADGASPVGGTNLAYYNDVTGAPDTRSVIYDHYIRRTAHTDTVVIGRKTTETVEENPDTGAPVLSMSTGIVLAGIALVLAKRR